MADVYVIPAVTIRSGGRWRYPGKPVAVSQEYADYLVGKHKARLAEAEELPEAALAELRYQAVEPEPEQSEPEPEAQAGTMQMFGAPKPEPKPEAEAGRTPQDTDEVRFVACGLLDLVKSPPDGFEVLCKVPGWAVFVKGGQSLDKLKRPSLDELALALGITDLSGNKPDVLDRILAHPVFAPDDEPE